MREQLQVRSLKADALRTTVGQLAAILLQIAFFLVLVRILDTFQYGLFLGAAAFVAIVAQFSTLGQGTLLIRQLSQGDAAFESVWGTTLQTAALGCLVTGLFALITAPYILHRSALLRLVPILLVSDLVCNKLVELASQAFQASHDFSTASRINILPNLAKLSAVLCALCQVAVTKRHLDAFGWSLWYAVASAVACSLALLEVRQKLGRARHGRFARETLGEGLAYAVSGASFYIYNDIDKTLLAADGFVVEAGFYGAAYRLIEVITAPLRALNTAALPRFFVAGSKGVASVRSVMLRVMGPSVAYSFVAGCLVILLHGKTALLLGRQFGAAGEVLPYLAFIPLLRSLHYGAGNALTALSAQWVRAWIQIGAALFNVVINLYLITRFSWHGAAWSSVATEALLALAMTIALFVRAAGPASPVQLSQAEDMQLLQAEKESSYE